MRTQAIHTRRRPFLAAIETVFMLPGRGSTTTSTKLNCPYEGRRKEGGRREEEGGRGREEEEGGRRRREQERGRRRKEHAEN